MSAWTNLLAASSLAIGTAWDLITHPKTGGSGTIVVDAITMTADGPTTMTIDDSPVIVMFPDQPTMTVQGDSAISLTAPDQITLEVSP